MIIRHLSIDCAYINKVLEPITQREHGVTEFEIEAKNHRADIDLSECMLATYYGLKPDEHKVGVECRVDKYKSLIYLPLYLQMTTAEGVLKGIVELQFPEGNVRFSGVNFKVSFAPDDTKVESTDDFNILENFIFKPTIDGVAGQVLSIDSDGNTIWRALKEFDGDYAHLIYKPSINGVELNGDKSLEDLNIKQTYTADDISFADGETFQQKFNNGELKGQDGVSGADGITPHIGDNGNWFIGETDTNKPSQGTNGVNGNDGVGITKSEVNTSGELVITYSNGDSANLGKIVGKDGLDGSENRFTATGGYSWDNYTKDPALLPSNLGNNHLWNPNTDDIDFNYFMQKYGNGETINYVVALIGWNDYDMRNTTWKDYATEGISAIERKARKFIGRLHEQYPNCHVLLVGYHVSTTAERNMHPNLPYESRNKFVWELNDLYKSFEDEFSFVHFIHTASQFDSYNNMRKQNTKPNIYAVNTIEMVTDDVHPAPEGYYQYGDAELRCLMYLMQNEN